jgi:hypothetical protein
LKIYEKNHLKSFTEVITAREGKTPQYTPTKSIPMRGRKMFSKLARKGDSEQWYQHPPGL